MQKSTLKCPMLCYAHVRCNSKRLLFDSTSSSSVSQEAAWRARLGGYGEQAPASHQSGNFGGANPLHAPSCMLGEPQTPTGRFNGGTLQPGVCERRRLPASAFQPPSCCVTRQKGFTTWMLPNPASACARHLSCVTALPPPRHPPAPAVCITPFVKQGRLVSTITREELESCFHMPSEQACKHLG